MTTEGNSLRLHLQPLDWREVVVRFDGGPVSSDGGGLLGREADWLPGIIRQFAAWFADLSRPRSDRAHGRGAG